MPRNPTDEERERMERQKKRATRLMDSLEFIKSIADGEFRSCVGIPGLADGMRKAYDVITAQFTDDLTALAALTAENHHLQRELAAWDHLRGTLEP